MQALLAIAALLVAGAFVSRRRGGELLEELVVTAKRIATREWDLPPAGEPYRLTIEAVEGQYAIPKNLLARLLYQESRFRDDIIRGDVVSSAGAVGIAQIVPKWHPGIDPTDPIASIWYAGAYLVELKRQFGSWDRALAAYNWGPGNLRVAIAQAGEDQWTLQAPAETREYVAQISADVPTKGLA